MKSRKFLQIKSKGKAQKVYTQAAELQCNKSLYLTVSEINQKLC